MGRPEPVVLVVPLALSMAIGLAAVDSPEVSVRTRLDPSRVTEDDVATLTVELSARRHIASVDVLAVVPSGLVALAPDRRIALEPGQPRRLDIRARAVRWGSYSMGELSIRARSPVGFLRADGRCAEQHRLIVYPQPQALRRLVRAHQTQPAAGSHLARAKGAGVEFADIRPFASGDRVREINWRASARRAGLWVNERHPDRSSDVVLFLDTFGGPTLAAAVRAADSLATAYLAQHDRVGLVSFGGVMHWLRPGMGLRQQYLVVDTLLSTVPFASVAWKDIALVPPRVLPPKALVLAITPLEDERACQALINLRSRGIDLVIIEVSPVSHVAAAPGPTGEIAYRLWRLTRDAQRDNFRALGVPTVEWCEAQPLTPAIEELLAWRRGRRAG
jgi:uncharacterized protein (DUF58 family)